MFQVSGSKNCALQLFVTRVLKYWVLGPSRSLIAVHMSGVHVISQAWDIHVRLVRSRETYRAYKAQNLPGPRSRMAFWDLAWRLWGHHFTYFQGSRSGKFWDNIQDSGSCDVGWSSRLMSGRLIGLMKANLHILRLTGVPKTT